MNAIKWISSEAKKIRRAHPRKYTKWSQYIREASSRYARVHKSKKSRPRTRKVGEAVTVKYKRVAPALPKYSGAVSGVKTSSRTHTDKNRITANIQVGKAGLGTLTAEIRRRLVEKRDYLVLRRYHETTKRGKAKITKQISALNRQITKLK